MPIETIEEPVAHGQRSLSPSCVFLCHLGGGGGCSHHHRRLRSPGTGSIGSFYLAATKTSPAYCPRLLLKESRESRIPCRQSHRGKKLFEFYSDFYREKKTFAHTIQNPAWILGFAMERATRGVFVN